MLPEEANPIRRLLDYSWNTAGGLMTTEPVILDPTATVAEALAHVRNPDLSPATASQVYVVRPPTDTPTGRYLGVAHLQRLLREPPATLVSAIIDTDIAPLRPDVSLPAITSHLATYNLVAAPVVDDDDRLLGAVTVDDVLDHLLPDGWRDTDPSEPANGGTAPTRAPNQPPRVCPMARREPQRARLDQPKADRRVTLRPELRPRDVRSACRSGSRGSSGPPVTSRSRRSW